jgi:hypothetical protein
VNLWRTQHPNTMIFEGGLTPPMLATLLVCVAAFTVLYVIMVIQRAGIRAMDIEVKRLRTMQAE